MTRPLFRQGHKCCGKRLVINLSFSLNQKLTTKLTCIHIEIEIEIETKTEIKIEIEIEIKIEIETEIDRDAGLFHVSVSLNIDAQDK